MRCVGFARRPGLGGRRLRARSPSSTASSLPNTHPAESAVRPPATTQHEGTSCNRAPARRRRCCAAAMAAPKLELTYFVFPGRGEVARLILTLGGVEFKDHRIRFRDWPAIKPTTPFGQVPVLTADGKPLAQSAAIDRYCASLAGLLPTDPWAVAQADQLYFFCEDVWQVLAATFRIKDPEEKLKVLEELVGAGLKDKLLLLSKHVEARPGKFLTGDALTHADLAVFSVLSTLQSGTAVDGIPRELLDGYPVLKAFRNQVASLPEVAAFYAKEDDDIRNNGFRADAA